MFSAKVRGLKELEVYLKTVPRGAVKVALDAAADWFIGTPERGLRQYPKYKHVTRKKAYGQTFSSPEQRYKFFGMLKRGEVNPEYPRRTGRTQRGYYKDPAGDGYKIKIKNDEPGAYFTRDDKGQANLNKLAGWRKASDVIKSNMSGAIRHAISKVSEYLKTVKK